MLGAFLFGILISFPQAHACETDDFRSEALSFAAVDAVYDSSLPVLLDGGTNPDSLGITIQIQTARTFVDKYAATTDFDLDNAVKMAGLLNLLGENASIPPDFRCKAYLLSAAVHGRIADKLRANGGTKHGKDALNAIKAALRVNPNYADAAKAYAATISRMAAKNFITRKFIQAGLDINLETEAKAAMSALERVNLKTLDTYQELAKFVD